MITINNDCYANTITANQPIANQPNMYSQTDKITSACQLLYDASRSVRILTHLSWPLSVREQFFRCNCEELPVVEYEKYDPSIVFEKLKIAESAFEFDAATNDWLFKIANRLETSARMLASVGTNEFFQYSVDLYGSPTQELIDEENTPLGLATKFDELFAQFQSIDLGESQSAQVTAADVGKAMESAAEKMFGESAPKVSVVDKLSANALAGPRRIRIRDGANFSENDVRQLIHHEAHIHVATSLNGLAQPHLKILAAAHPGTTKTQEGLAVFAEFITGSMDLDRFRRLADRVIAIHMAADGANFIEVFNYFLDRTDDPEQAFENARRVFRGGILSGGAPFTKDVVYLDGLIRVHNFFRTAVSAGRADCLRLLFCGKLDIEDIPILAKFAAQGICQPAKFLPPWASDIRFLLCYLTYSSFLNRIDLSRVKKHYNDMLQTLPAITCEF